MIVSRCIFLSKLSPVARRNFLLQIKDKNVNQISRKAHGEFRYRQLPELTETKDISTIFIGALGWWWVFWHLLTDFGTLKGHNYPDPSKWTDEELGIPADD